MTINAFYVRLRANNLNSRSPIQFLAHLNFCAKNDAVNKIGHIKRFYDKINGPASFAFFDVAWPK
jgi:hypothetical protein